MHKMDKNYQGAFMKNIGLMSALLVVSFNTFAGAFSTDVSIKGNLTISPPGAKEILLNSSGTSKLLATYAEAEFDYMPSFGRGDLIIKQGPNVIKLKIPKDRYSDEGQFTLYSVDSGLVHDIYMRRSESRVVASMDIKQNVPCNFQKYKGMNNGVITYEAHPGNQYVLNRHEKINRDYIMSFVRDQKTEANLKQTLESQKVTTLKALSGCIPNDPNILFK